MSDQSKRPFNTPSVRMAFQKVQKLLGIRSFTRKALEKAGAVAIFIGFGKRLSQIFPFRKQRNRAERLAQMKNRNRIPIPRIEGIDVGRRRHYVPPERIFACLS
jgi:hypothetical protein